MAILSGFPRFAVVITLTVINNVNVFGGAVVASQTPHSHSRCCFVEDGKEMYRDSKRTCIAIVLLIKPLFGDALVAVAVC